MMDAVQRPVLVPCEVVVKTECPVAELSLCQWHQHVSGADAVNIRVCVCVFGTIADVPSCNGLCLGLAIGLTIAVVVAIIAIVLVVQACRLRSRRWSRTGGTTTNVDGPSQHKTVIQVSTDNLTQENPYCHIDNSAYTPESMEDVYLHPEHPIEFNSTL